MPAFSQMTRIALMSLCVAIIASSAFGQTTKPNVIVILADDMGIDSVGAFNDKLGLETPSLDRLSKESISFVDAHSTSGVCSPTRYSLLTGRYNWRSRLKHGIVGKWERPLIADARLTLPEMFQKNGYATAMIGKWHLGWNWPKTDGSFTSQLDEIDFAKPIKGGPIDHGFQYYFGDDVPNWPPYAWFENDRLQGEITTKMKAGTMLGVSAGPAVENWDFSNVLLEYVKRYSQYVRARKDEERPFFLYVPMPSPHTPIAPGGKFEGITKISAYADFLVETDWAVGEILRALDETGQAENTIVFFTCDNGTSPKANFSQLESNGVHLREHWRGCKADAYEGGHRVPFMVRWPGTVKPNTRSDEIITLCDIMATCAELLQEELPENAAEDSVSLMPVLRGENSGQPLHHTVVHHSINGHFAIRKGDWKLMLCRGSGGWSSPTEPQAGKDNLPMLQLYNLKDDPKETKNLQNAKPEKVIELVNDLAAALKNGRTTPGPKQANEGNPNRIPKPILNHFPQLR